MAIDVMEALIEAVAICVGCGKPATGMCWTDCGMSLCGAPICGDCRHVDEAFGWSHKTRAHAQEAGL